MQALASVRQGDALPRSHTILLAEDSTDLRTLLAGALEADGHRVLQVASGTELLETARRVLHGGEEGGGLDLVVCDVRMPGMTGIAALHLLRGAGLRVPAIVITGFSDATTRAEAAANDATVLDKPVKLATLRALARQALSTTHP